ncbi:response regulator [Agathobaculum sp. LCP25S3_E8]|uniref:response regulator n=1 Tax=Agathobaculum sp. LCP25S3_E8 TaxID=3438735 RepID=UPI003F8E04C7
MKKYNVLLVDDSRVVHDEMMKMLADSEFQIQTYCRSGENALSVYADAAPDLVLMDIVMAGMCGLEAGRKILCQWPDARILVVSALVYDDVIEEINEFGDKGLVAEPFNRDNLLEAMRKAVA